MPALDEVHVALLPVSVLPALQAAGPVYMAGAISLGIAYLAAAALFCWRRDDRAARTLLQTSIAAAGTLAAPQIKAQSKPEKLVYVGDNGPWHYAMVEEITPAFEKATGIKIGRKCRSLHFLHAAKSQTKDGSPVGSYLVHYANHEVRTLPIIYGKDVRAWVTEPDAPLTTRNSQIVWIGPSPLVQSWSMCPNKLFPLPRRHFSSR
jgi:hypothetical protein